MNVFMHAHVCGQEKYLEVIPYKLLPKFDQSRLGVALTHRGQKPFQHLYL